MIKFKNIQELITLANEKNIGIYDVVIQYEAQTAQVSTEKILERMKQNWKVMRESVESGIQNQDKSASGLVGGDAKKMYAYATDSAKPYAGVTPLKVASYALAVGEVNAVMGKIVACPTAGSCGILPAAVLAGAEQKNCSEDKIIDALFTAAGIGMVIAQNASIAGAEGGCQAECGSAAAMATAALVELAEGTPEQVGQAVALALKNLLGLVCDPVAGLVEVPCVKRNGFASVHAMVAADMALAGIESVIPVDEVIEAMYKIGLALPKSLRETSEAGLADTPTARIIEKKLYEKK
ncbi:L-serine ammonia-lyase, iron-sulfur-dependent, subunit alpha [Anaerosinus massiliensis]|uniref:L-serine ammonia-lyase, iron-sulfur-dependent, subunit alpha n=1 Tax=Massilibacillus massiliensis TaxID=1806837 RepID=UPI000B20E907|nr:L-serine ammonia-lyase, iron-sulfur-dependent, subunit alpha [Massilibacillus massiliensis]